MLIYSDKYQKMVDTLRRRVTERCVSGREIRIEDLGINFGGTPVSVSMRSNGELYIAMGEANLQSETISTSLDAAATRFIRSETPPPQ